MNRPFDVRSYTGFYFISCLCLFILYAPLIVVMVYSFNDSISITKWGGISFRWYFDIFNGQESENFKLAGWNSVIIAIMAATFSTLVATAAAIGMIRGGILKENQLLLH